MECPRCHKEVILNSFFCTWCSIFMPLPQKGKKANLFVRWLASAIDLLIGVILYFVSLWLFVTWYQPTCPDAGMLLIIPFLSGYFVSSLTLLILFISILIAHIDIRVVSLILFLLGYFVWSLTLLWKGLTPGKKLLGLQVVNQRTGEIPGFGKMLIRESVWRLLSRTFLGIGYFWALFDKNAQAWHDKLAGTVVVKISK